MHQRWPWTCPPGGTVVGVGMLRRGRFPPARSSPLKASMPKDANAAHWATPASQPAACCLVLVAV
eukprot:8175507-Pyramimonas_sp.AAC.1